MMQGKPFLHIEVDEHSSEVGLVTRVEAFVNSLINLETIKAEKAMAYLERMPRKNEHIKKGFHDLRPGTIIHLPQMLPYADVVKELLRAKGIAAEMLPPTDRDAMDIGRRYTIAGEYFSLTCLLGRYFPDMPVQPQTVPPWPFCFPGMKVRKWTASTAG